MTMNNVKLRLSGSNFTDSESFKKATFINKLGGSAYNYGLPLLSTSDEIYVANNEGHNAILGETGGGKSESVSIPQTALIALSGCNGMIIDPKGDLYRKTYGIFKQQGYKIHVLNFRDLKHSSGFNPLSVIYEKYSMGNTESHDQAIEMVHDMSQTIMNMQANSTDPFWDVTSSQNFAGFILALMECAETQNEVNLKSILQLMDYFSSKSKGSADIDRFTKYLKNKSIPAYTKLSSLFYGPNDTAASIRSVTSSKMEIFYSSEQLIQILSYSSFTPKDFLDEKTVLFIILPDENKKYHQIAALIIKQIYSWLVSYASSSPAGKLAHKLCILIEEMGNMNLGPETVQMITAARSRNINFTIVIQSMSQLLEMYGTHTAATILYNCRNWICLPHREPELQSFIIKSAGNREYMVKGQYHSQPLITSAGLNSLAVGEALAFVRGSIIMKTKFKRFTDLNFHCNNIEIEYPTLKKDEVLSFDVSSFMQYLGDVDMRIRIKILEEKQERAMKADSDDEECIYGEGYIEKNRYGIEECEYQQRGFLEYLNQYTEVEDDD